jgi:phosphoribosyl 1,2-cyclic phosphodiesterase
MGRHVQEARLAAIRVKFWGVRGSVPVPGEHTSGIGGNTSCVEIRAGDRILVFDGGTGLRLLGKSLVSAMPVTVHLFFSHMHWDHIQGFPFFGPAFVPGNTIHMYGGAQVAGRVETAMVGQMESPSFPVRLEQLPATLRFHDLHAGDTVEIAPDVRVRCAAGNHPGGVLAYRVEHAGRAVVYMTDHEPDQGKQPQGLLDLARDADILIYDCQYTPEEYAGKKDGISRVGWGHSTFEVGAAFAKSAGVKELLLYHHDPDQNDIDVATKVARTTKLFKNSRAAYEGLEIPLDEA